MSQDSDSDHLPFTWWSPERSGRSVSPQPAQPTVKPYICVRDQYEIIEQLAQYDSDIRFQCLAFTQGDGNSEQIRCLRNCINQSKPSILAKAKQVLQQGSVIDSVTYVEDVIRILFCTIHSRPKVFKQFQNSLRKSWKGDGNPEETETLKAIRQAFQISCPETDSIGTFSPSRDDWKRPDLKTKTYYSTPQPKTSTEEREPVSPFSRPHRIRSFSNPSLARPGTRVANPPFDGASKSVDSHSQTTSKNLLHEEDNVPDSSLPDMAHQAIPFRFRQATNGLETPKRRIEQSSFSKEYWAHFDFGSAFPSTKSIPNGVSKDDISLIQKSSPEDRDTSIHHQTPIADTTPRQRAATPTVKHDKSRLRITKDTDESIKSVILATVPAGEYIYVLRAPNYFATRGETPCVKIGISSNVNKRMKQLQDICGLKDLERVKDPLDMPHHHAKRVEQLCHAELSNFNQILKCDSPRCKNKEGRSSEHKEWFAVPEDVALKTVQRWRNFIQQEPYDENGIIHTDWSAKLRPGKFSTPPDTERDDDHEARDRRWTAWLESGIAKINHGLP